MLSLTLPLGIPLRRQEESLRYNRRESTLEYSVEQSEEKGLAGFFSKAYDGIKRWKKGREARRKFRDAKQYFELLEDYYNAARYELGRLNITSGEILNPQRRDPLKITLQDQISYVIQLGKILEELERYEVYLGEDKRSKLNFYRSKIQSYFRIVRELVEKNRRYIANIRGNMYMREKYPNSYFIQVGGKRLEFGEAVEEMNRILDIYAPKKVGPENQEPQKRNYFSRLFRKS